MSEPLPPIGKKSQPSSLPSSPPPASDPTARFAQEFSKMNQLLEDLSQRMQALEKRGIPATKSEVDTLLAEAKKGTTVTVDSQQVADLLAPAWQAKSQEAVKAIEQVTNSATGRITHAASYSAHAWSGRFGFTSGKAVFTILGGGLLLIMGLMWYGFHQHERAELATQTSTKAENDLKFYKDYDAWLDDKYPKIWPVYEQELKKLKKAQAKN